MTQPAVTRQIRALERRLGAELFVRTANRSELSELGGTAVDHVSAGFDVIEAGLAELADHAGNFVLAAHPGIAQQWLAARLDELTESLGDLDLRLWLFDSDADIADGGFDAAIRVGSGDFPRLQRSSSVPGVVVPVASPAFAAQYGLVRRAQRRDVFRRPVRAHGRRRPAVDVLGATGSSQFGITLRRQPGRVLFHNYPMVLQQALLGYGIALGWWASSTISSTAGPAHGRTRGPIVSRLLLTWPTTTSTEVVTRLADWLLEEFDPLRRRRPQPDQ